MVLVLLRPGALVPWEGTRGAAAALEPSRREAGGEQQGQTLMPQLPRARAEREDWIHRGRGWSESVGDAGIRRSRGHAAPP